MSHTPTPEDEIPGPNEVAIHYPVRVESGFRQFHVVDVDGRTIASCIDNWHAEQIIEALNDTHNQRTAWLNEALAAAKGEG
jgi:hypothetical protein